jgi:predicted DNA-binding ribbon-helix-helix protein
MDQLKNIKKSVVIKRSITINGHKTSVSLENEFWDGLHEVARDEHTTVPMLVEQIDRSGDNCNHRLQFAYSFSATVCGARNRERRGVLEGQ